MTAESQGKISFYCRAFDVTRQAVIDYLNEHDSMTVEELQNLLNIKRTRAYNLYKKMESEGYIKVSGRGAGKIITLK